MDFLFLFYQWNVAAKAVEIGARIAAVSDPVATNLDASQYQYYSISVTRDRSASDHVYGDVRWRHKHAARARRGTCTGWAAGYNPNAMNQHRMWARRKATIAMMRHATLLLSWVCATYLRRVSASKRRGYLYTIWAWLCGPPYARSNHHRFTAKSAVSVLFSGRLARLCKCKHSCTNNDDNGRSPFICGTVGKRNVEDIPGHSEVCKHTLEGHERDHFALCDRSCSLSSSVSHSSLLMGLDW